MTITEQERADISRLTTAEPAPRLSLVVPAYNEAERLRWSIPRLLAVIPHEETEVIIVDDGSTDETAEVATRALAVLPHGRVIRLPRNSGKGAAVRAGVVEARGEIIAYMDADMATEPARQPCCHRLARPRLVGGPGQERTAPVDDPDLRARRRGCGRSPAQ
jgi:glycosyltransferase involved in cell wall biosynthesis